MIKEKGRELLHTLKGVLDREIELEFMEYNFVTETSHTKGKVNRT